MGRDDFEEEEAAELARRIRHQVGVFQPELFYQLQPVLALTPRTTAVMKGLEPEAARAWMTLWMAHNRHPTWVARAVKLLLSFKLPDGTPFVSCAPAASAAIAGFEKVHGYRKSGVQAWWNKVQP